MVKWYDWLEYSQRKVNFGTNISRKRHEPANQI